MALLMLGLALGLPLGVAWERRQTVERHATSEAEIVESSTKTASTAPVFAASTVSDVPLDRQQIRDDLRKIRGQWSDARRREAILQWAAMVPVDSIRDALDEIERMPDEELECERGLLFTELLDRWAKVNPSMAMGYAHGIKGWSSVGENLSMDFQLQVLDSWITTDSEAALGWARSLPGSELKTIAFERLASCLVEQDPERALVLLNGLEPAAIDRCQLLVFEKWAAVDPARAARRWYQGGNPISDDVGEVIFPAWMEKQPAAAMEWAKALPEGSTREKALKTCLLSLSSSRGEEALQLSQTLPAGTWRNDVVVQIVKTWAANDLNAASIACSQMPDGVARDRAMQAVVEEWISQDPKAASDHVRNLPPGRNRQKAIERLSQEWAHRDLQGGMDWAQSLPSGPERIEALANVVKQWAQVDPRAAVEFTTQNAGLPRGVLNMIAEEWANKDFSSARQWGKSLNPGPAKDGVLAALAEHATYEDPKSAASLCMLISRESISEELLKNIASSWGTTDLPSAVEWARNLTDGGARQAALDEVSTDWASYDPQGMVAYALTLPPGESQGKYLDQACQELAGRDLPAALRTVQQLPEGELRRSLMESVGAQSAKSPDQAAISIAALAPGNDQNAAVDGLVSAWAEVEPESAANWLQSFPGNNPQTTQLRKVVEDWARWEPAGAAQWLASQPDGSVMDESVTGAFVEGAVQQHPEYAAQWAQSLKDETHRQKCQALVAQCWMQTDPAAAQTWIEGLNLSKQDKQKLLTQSQ
jgi:hypothetical protein